MRTTVTIDDHLLAEAKVLAARSHRTLGSIVEDGLRRVIDAGSERPAPGERYTLPTFEPDNPGLRPGVDLYPRPQLPTLRRPPRAGPARRLG